MNSVDNIELMMMAVVVVVEVRWSEVILLQITHKKHTFTCKWEFDVGLNWLISGHPCVFVCLFDAKSSMASTDDYISLRRWLIEDYKTQNSWPRKATEMIQSNKHDKMCCVIDGMHVYMWPVLNIPFRNRGICWKKLKNQCSWAPCMIYRPFVPR